MFSENKKISGRQAFRLLTYDLLGIGTLLVPPFLGRTAGRDGIFCILFGMGAGLLYLWLLKGVLLEMKGDFPGYLKEKLGKFGSRVIFAGYLMYFVLLAAYTAYLFSVIVLRELLREESYWLVLALILVLAFYGMWHGIEGRARVYELLFWVVMIPLFLMLFSALDGIRTDYWAPVFCSDVSGIFEGSYYVFLSLSLVSFILFSGGYVEKRESLLVTGRRVILFTGSIYAVLYFILLGTFGAAALGTMEFPAVTLMSTVKVTGGFLKRTDAFMFGIWFFTLYALLGSTVFYGGKMLRAFTGMECDRSQRKCIRRERWSVAIVLCAVFVVAGVFYKSRAACKDYESFLWYIGTPFLLLVPFLLAVRRLFSDRGKKGENERSAGAGKKAVHMILLCILSGSMLSGCGTAELEERSFPTVLAVENPREFAAQWLDVNEMGNRVVDYNHLKVLILGKDFIEDEEAMEEFLDFLEKKAEVPRNTYVVVSENPKELLELQGGEGKSVGNYLEELFENVSEIRKKMYPTLGLLYQEKENRTETLLLPYVAADGEKPVVKAYYLWKRGKPEGVVDTETALLSFFTQNGMDAYTILLEEGALCLTAAHNEIRFSEENGKTIVVDIDCNGEFLYKKEENNSRSIGGMAQTEKEIEHYMNTIAAAALERELDVTNSYRKLGGYMRDWYFLYRKDAASYEKDVNTVYRVHITWINL